ncbi:MAG TPA: bifunctional phosphoribosylaminoimidazolecarboxamide formyltransferase/IMP cyclohydrolase [Myxococcales bacterium]|nr:bifunctional phosphoribosylaminoimidazolecarboxamide formyltransferase/IMP cyclohydrolase [Myxococcales bacterium]HIK86626.1 bifunctional phosphoribosylaminoimidazolecarboxamide formyltransferase/IMP cyclohydrolase [Myxococcales bacterium]
MPPSNSSTSPAAGSTQEGSAQTRRPVVRALLSVSNKAGLVELAKDLTGFGVELVASGGTASAIRDAGLSVLDVSELTASPEMLGGRVKTLHPKIHGGILARRDLAEDQADLEAHSIRLLDLVVCNLYPFEATVARADVTRAEAVEKIDIGGPSMIRSAAKNHAYVGVVCDPTDYVEIVTELREAGGLSDATRRRLALKAFQHTASYDAAISQWLGENDPEVEAEVFPDSLLISLEKSAELRYGENPHQRAALYGGFLELAELLHGKALSYNNLIDAQAALALILDFDPADRAVVAILKHNTPCGVGAGSSPLEAYENAFATDPDSPFGGIIVSNRPFDVELAAKVDEIFTEVLIGPSFTDEALELLKKKKNRRLLAFDRSKIDPGQVEVRRVFGGLLVQESDPAPEEVKTATLATQTTPSDEQRIAMEFAWRVVKHVKSNAIVFALADRTLAIGGGATSRVDAVHAAAAKAARVGLPLEGSVLASDAFFPFADGLETAVAAGAAAVIQPGGSNRDEEVTAAADKLGVPMLMTGTRHFRH